MTEINVAERARAALLAATAADAWCTRAHDRRQADLFRVTPRLSDDIWVMLATCESIARSGSALHPDPPAAILDEWVALDRLRAAPAENDDPTLRLAPLGFVLDAEDPPGRLALQAALRGLGGDAATAVNAEGVVTAVRRSVLLSRVANDGASPDRDTRVGLALALAAGSAGDLVTLMETVAPQTRDDHPVEWPQAVVLAAFLLGAAGSDVPRRLIAGIPDLDAVETVIEPFAQLIAAAGAWPAAGWTVPGA